MQLINRMLTSFRRLSALAFCVDSAEEKRSGKETGSRKGNMDLQNFSTIFCRKESRMYANKEGLNDGRRTARGKQKIKGKL